MEFNDSLLVLTLMTAIFAVLVTLGRNELVRRRLTCPQSGLPADVDVVQRYHRPDKPVHVKRCSLLAHPERVDCGEGCLERTP